MPINLEELPAIRTVEEGTAVIKFLVRKFNQVESELLRKISKLEEEIGRFVINK